MANTLTNTTDTIIGNLALDAFTAAIAPLRAFALDASAAPAARGDKVKVLAVPAATAAANFAGTYTMQDSTATGTDITLSGHKFVSWYLTDTQIANAPQVQMERFAKQKGFALAKAVVQDIWSQVTNANYGAAAFTGAASTFDSADVADIRAVCSAADWPLDQRALIIDDAYYAYLLKDSGIKAANAFGSDAAIRQGIVGRLFGFDIYESTLVPANGENLVGFACVPDAMVVAMRYLAPGPDADYANAQAFTDPESGITIGMRTWYDKSTGQSQRVLEASYGYNVGTAAGLKRLVSA